MADQQPGLPGVEQERVTFVSASSLDLYERCPRLYRFIHLDKLGRLRRADWRASFGSSIHAALRDLYRTPPGRRSLATLETAYARGWAREGYPNRRAEDAQKAAGLEALRRWYGAGDTSGTPHATEVGLQARIGDIVLRGRLDRIDRDAEGLVVIDYKSSSRPLTQAEADADRALTIYTALVERHLARPVSRLVLDYVVAGVRVVTRRPPEVLRQALDGVLAEAARLRADDQFAPRTGAWCAQCDFLALCPEGQAASRAHGRGSRTAGAVG